MNNSMLFHGEKESGSDIERYLSVRTFKIYIFHSVCNTYTQKQYTKQQRKTIFIQHIFDFYL